MTAPAASIRRVAILAHVGNGNLGDEATIASLIQNARARLPEVELIGFSLNPADTHQRHGIAAYPLRREIGGNGGLTASTAVESCPVVERGFRTRLRDGLKSIPGLRHLVMVARSGVDLLLGAGREAGFLRRSMRLLRGTDLLLIVGGGQLGDYFGGPWGYPYTICKWSSMARAAGAQVAFVSVGAGPIQHRFSKFFLRYALERAQYRSFRDADSRSLVESLGVNGENVVTPDLVHSLEVPEATAGGVAGRAGQVIGINPLPFFDPRYWVESDVGRYQSYVRTLADFAAWLIETNHRVLFFPTQLKADHHVIADIEQVLKTKQGLDRSAILRPTITSFDDLVAALAMCDAVVASRFHGVIIAHLLNKPALGLAYQQKTTDLMVQMGQSELALDIHKLTLEDLIARFRLLEFGRHAAARQVEHRRADYRATLASQYDWLFGPRARAETSAAESEDFAPAVPGVGTPVQKG